MCVEHIKLMHAIWRNIWRLFCWTHTQLCNGPLSQRTLLLIFLLRTLLLLLLFLSIILLLVSIPINSFTQCPPPSPPSSFSSQCNPHPPAPQTRLTLSYFPPPPTSPTNLLSGESPDGGQGNGGLMKAGERGGKHKHKKGLLVQLGRAPGIHLLYLFSHSI